MSPSRTYTADFREQFAIAEQRLLRRRFMWFSGVLGALGTITVLVILASKVLPYFFGEAITVSGSGKTLEMSAKVIITSGVSTMFYVGTFVYAWLGKPNDRVMLQLSLGLVIADGLLNIAVRAFDIMPFGGAGSFMITHIIACAVLPWRVNDALATAGIVLGVSTLSILAFEKGVNVGSITGCCASLLFAAPGTIIAWLRHSRRLKGYQFRFLQQRYGQVRRELTDARRIHEAMFPVPVTRGPVRLTYRYQPMSVIGGDFLHVHRTDDGHVMNTVLLDVTGHGIPAALTVNRLYGELERVFAEDPTIAPACVLEKLNRYVHLTMSEHSVFVTGLCLRADAQRGTLEYANAGHPPAFLISADGRIDQLDSTGMVLGALPHTAEDEGPMQRRFEPGDRLIAYTDGATEARAQDGEMLRIAGLQRVLAGKGPIAEGSWPVRVLEAVDQHRAGPPDDDTLVVELYRPVGA